MSRRPIWSKRRLLSVVSVLLLVAAGLSGMLLVKQNSDREKPGRVAEGSPAPEIAIAVPGSGERVQLSDFKGRTVLVHFWASWCVPCKRELPLIDKAAHLTSKGDHKDEAGAASGAGNEQEILAINVGESRGTINEFTGETGISMPIVSDVTGQAAEAFRVRALPASFIISPDGRISQIIQGEFTSVEEIQAALDAG
ncbi:Peroxiredoxin [Paenibacillaceae bacterium GAS479]|nr:Peroxiredoxin [Paenibacillaceae bacterium GAS479]